MEPQPNFLFLFLKYGGFFLCLGLNVEYWGFRSIWLLLGMFFYLLNEEFKKIKDKQKNTKRARIAFAKDATADEKATVLAKLEGWPEDLPSWVFKKVWPYLGSYLEALFKRSIEPSIDGCMPNMFRPFKFEIVDFGNVPIRVGGVKAYQENLKKDEVIIDLEIFYSSDTTIKMSVRGLAAGIKNVTIHGHLRLVLKPLVCVLPLFGGLSFFFLNPPSLDFDLTNVASILDTPIFSNALRNVLVDQIAYYMVLPNKIPIQVLENIDVDALLHPIPHGAIQLYIIGGRELRRADFRLIGQGTSDPYCKIFIGAQVFQTSVISNTITPTWNAYYEAVVDQKHGQYVEIECLDEDPGMDDELGIATLEVETVAEKGSIDTWLTLEGVDTGMIHVKANWLHLTRDVKYLENIVQKNLSESIKSRCEPSSALLMVFVDSAKSLPRSKKYLLEPSPYVKLTVGKTTKKSFPASKTSSPRWAETFNFFVKDPRTQDIFVELWDCQKDKRLGNVSVKLLQVLEARKMTIHRNFNLVASADTASILLRLCLRILTTEKPDGWEEDTNDDLEDVVKDPTELGSSRDG